MPEFKNTVDVKIWLDELPTSRRQRAAAVIATRTALRAFPFFREELSNTLSPPARDQMTNILQSYLGLVSLAYVQARFKNYTGETEALLHTRETARFHQAVLASSDDDGNGADAAIAAYSAAYSADDAAYTESPDEAAAAAAVAHDDVAYAANAGANAASEIFDEASNDANALDTGVAPAAVAGAPLWRSGMSAQTRNAWSAVKTILIAQDPEWSVWTDWYEARVAGDPAGAANPELEIERATISQEIWARGPDAVNDHIKRLIAAHAPRSPPRTIPPPNPAALDPIIQNARMTLAASPLPADMETAAITAAWQALRATIAAIAKTAATTNVDRRFVDRLREIAESIPESAMGQPTLFQRGHDYDELAAYVPMLKDTWPDHLEIRFAAMTLNFERALRQFPAWRAFISAGPIPLTPDQIAQIPSLIQSAYPVLSENPTVIDPVIPATLASLAAQLIPSLHSEKPSAATQALALDAIESLNNILKSAASAALEDTENPTSSFMTEALTGLRQIPSNLGKKVGPAVENIIIFLVTSSYRAAQAAVLTGSVKVTLDWALFEFFPEPFRWLHEILPLFNLP